MEEEQEDEDVVACFGLLAFLYFLQPSTRSNRKREDDLGKRRLLRE